MLDCRSAGTRKHSTRSSFFPFLGHVACTPVRVCDRRQGRTLVRLFHHRATSAVRICPSFQSRSSCNNNFASAIWIRTSPPFTFSQSHRSAPRFLFSNTLDSSPTLGHTPPLSGRFCRFKRRHPSLRTVWISRANPLRLDGGRSGYFHCAEELMETHRFIYEQLNFIYRIRKIVTNAT